jgi:Malectin domain
VFGYSVYRDGVNVATVSASAGTTYLDGTTGGLSPGTQHAYTVSALDKELFPRNESPQSVPVVATTLVINGNFESRINAGGPAYTDTAGNLWSADSVSTGGFSLDWGAHAVAGTSDPGLYRTEAYGPNLQYRLAVPNGRYVVNLCFAENWVDSTFPNGGIGYRVFSVLANGTAIVSNLDVFATVGKNTSLVKTATVTVTNGELVLSSPGGWMVDAIEVHSL